MIDYLNHSDYWLFICFYSIFWRGNQWKRLDLTQKICKALNRRGNLIRPDRSWGVLIGRYSIRFLTNQCLWNTASGWSRISRNLVSLARSATELRYDNRGNFLVQNVVQQSRFQFTLKESVVKNTLVFSIFLISGLLVLIDGMCRVRIDVWNTVEVFP